MLAHLRLRVVETLAPAQSATLSTTGPAGLQARVVPCEARDTSLYLLLSGTSDQLLNLEHEPTALVTTLDWQLQGTGQVLPLEDAPPDLKLLQLPQVPGCVLVLIKPTRLQINRRQGGWGSSETIDIH